MKPAKPSWWLLYIVVPVMIGLFFLEHQLVLSALGHEVAQAAILVFTFGLMVLWLRANRERFVDHTPHAREELRIRVYDLAQEATLREGEPGRQIRAGKPRNRRRTWTRSLSAERFERGSSIDRMR